MRGRLYLVIFSILVFVLGGPARVSAQLDSSIDMSSLITGLSSQISNLNLTATQTSQISNILVSASAQAETLVQQLMITESNFYVALWLPKNSSANAAGAKLALKISDLINFGVGVYINVRAVLTPVQLAQISGVASNLISNPTGLLTDLIGSLDTSGITSNLDLTAAQQKKLDLIFAATLKQEYAKLKGLQTSSAALNAAFNKADSTTSAGKKRIQAANKTVCSSVSGIILPALQAVVKAVAVLTPEQRAQLKAQMDPTQEELLQLGAAPLGGL